MAMLPLLDVIHKPCALNMRTDLSINWFNLLQRGQHKHGSLAHTRFGLAQDVHAQDSLWDAFMLDWIKNTKTRVRIDHWHYCCSNNYFWAIVQSTQTSGSPAGMVKFSRTWKAEPVTVKALIQLATVDIQFGFCLKLFLYILMLQTESHSSSVQEHIQILLLIQWNQVTCVQ